MLTTVYSGPLRVQDVLGSRDRGRATPIDNSRRSQWSVDLRGESPCVERRIGFEDVEPSLSLLDPGRHRGVGGGGGGGSENGFQSFRVGPVQVSSTPARCGRGGLEDILEFSCPCLLVCPAEPYPFLFFFCLGCRRRINRKIYRSPKVHVFT